MMRTIILSTVIVWLQASYLLAQHTAPADRIVGVWLSEKKDGKIQIYKTGTKYAGKLIWGRDMYEADGVTSKKDIHNSDEARRSRNLKDLVLLTDLTYDGNAWSGGNIYDPESGKTYRCVLKIKDNRLHIRGYLGVSLLGRTTEWTRAK